MRAFSTLQAHIGCHVLAETVEGEGEPSSVVYLRKGHIMYTVLHVYSASIARLCSCIHLLKNIYLSQIQYSLWNGFFCYFAFLVLDYRSWRFHGMCLPISLKVTYLIKTVISRVIFQEPCSVVSLRYYEYDWQVSNHNKHDYAWICVYGCIVKSIRSDVFKIGRYWITTQHLIYFALHAKIFRRKKPLIYILCHSSTLTWHRYLKAFLK